MAKRLDEVLEDANNELISVFGYGLPYVAAAIPRAKALEELLTVELDIERDWAATEEPPVDWQVAMKKRREIINTLREMDKDRP